MKLKGIDECDIVNYKKTSMFVIFPYCNFKCEKECGEHCCQNSALAQAPIINIDIMTLVKKYIDNPLTSAVVIGGLEPFDSWNDLKVLITTLREQSLDDIVIYSGYYEDEIQDKVSQLKQFPNIIIKFGRYIPNQQPHYDPILEVNLSSDNQYAEVIS
jgi:hypothetical protein